MNCTSVTPQSVVVCRLCTKCHENCVNIFISNELCEIIVEEVIQDLLGLPVAVGDGLPNVVCRPCLRKLIEFREFKNMCFKSASELRAYALDNDFLVSKIKDEDAADVANSREERSQENTFPNNIQLTEVYIAAPDELAIENVSHAKEELWSSENTLVVKEEVYDAEHHIEGDMPVKALTSVAVDPLAVDTMCPVEGDGVPVRLMDGREGANLEKKSPNVNEACDPLAFNNLCPVKDEFRPMQLLGESTSGMWSNSVDGESRVAVAPYDLSLDSLALENQTDTKEVYPRDPLGEYDDSGDGDFAETQFNEEAAVCSESKQILMDDKVDCCNNIGGLKEEPEKESDTFGADRQGISQNKVLNNSYCDPVREESLQLEHSMANSFVVNCSPEERVKNVKFYALSKKTSQLNDRSRPIRNQEREQFCHQAENAIYPIEYICNYCRTSCMEKKSLALHIRRHVDGKKSASVLPKKSLKCELCGKNFKNTKSLKRHSVIHTSVKQFKCNDCGKIFAQRGRLYSHSVVHTGVKPFKCNECGKVFARRSDLNTHSVVHTGVKRFKCNDCGKMFARRGRLYSHSVVHTGVKPFKCNECGKMFARRSDLNTQSVVHTGVKRFKCNECGKMFTTSSNLKSHSLVHTGVKPFKCNDCGKMFAQSSGLNRHIVIHTGEKAYKCNVCGKVFSQSSHLKSHSDVHTGVKRFKCNECGKMFTKSGNLNKHLSSTLGCKNAN